MTTLTDQQAFLAAINDAPDDMTIRLAYADWLEERREVPCWNCNGLGRISNIVLHDYPCGECSGHGTILTGTIARSQRIYCAVQAILADPDSDEPRLRCAELFERMGEKDRGEFIRVQCELAKADPCPFTIYRPEWETENNPLKKYVFGLGPEPKPSCGWCSTCLLKQREKELSSNCNGICHDCRWHAPLVHNHGHAWGFERGFIKEVRTTLSEWLAHGEAICREHPVSTVTVTDRRPGYVERDPGFNCWTWFNDESRPCLSTIPRKIWELIPHGWFPTEEDAILALPCACLAWARAKAKGVKM
jgi:uncharacterized protein (TIGR02996 family)